MIKVGDIVKVASLGEVYTTYPEFLKRAPNLSPAQLAKYRMCTKPDKKKSYVVQCIGEHEDFEGEMLAYITDATDGYIVNVDGLRKADDISVMLMQLVECFEDFLEEKGITIPNEEKEGNEHASNIYGTDYGNLCDGLQKIVEEWGF